MTVVRRTRFPVASVSRQRNSQHTLLARVERFSCLVFSSSGECLLLRGKRRTQAERHFREIQREALESGN
jgi:hypothetical protein